jgi:anaerobic magnesium-protoporphyrin IX monomethyl ester cyclase
MGSKMDRNLGTRRIPKVPEAKFPSADTAVALRAAARMRESKLNVLLVNPPAPDGGIWIRSQHRVGRRSRENMIWPQVSLAQLAALLYPDYSVEIVDAIALRMSWGKFLELLRDRMPHYYITQIAAPTLTNDMYGIFLAKSLRAVTIGFGTHVTPMAVETLRAFPALDFVLRGEPEATLRELIDTVETARGRWVIQENSHLLDPVKQAEPEAHARMWKIWTDANDNWAPAWSSPGEVKTCDETPREFCFPPDHQLEAIKGLGWRKQGSIVINPDRPFIRSLDDLPIPLHHLLPFNHYRAPLVKGPYTFIVPSRGCPAGCKFCIKHVNYQYSVRLRSPEKLVEEMSILKGLGIHHVQMYADLFTASRDQVMELCQLMQENKLDMTWTCNSRVDFVDQEMLREMAKAGCMLIAWGIESANEMVLKRAHKGYRLAQAGEALTWARQAGIMNWGYFIIGLPGETVESIKETIQLSKRLPLDIALFHVAAPYPGTPFFFEVLENGWFRPGTNWEEVDMDAGTVLDYPNLKAEELLYWQRRAFREWALRPGPLFTYLKSMNTWQGLKSALNIGMQTLGWLRG